jgi:peptide subunit release factor 1 (eRF1)
MREKEKKTYRCPKCGWRSSTYGTCPSCKTKLEKICECDSGRYAKECCKR